MLILNLFLKEDGLETVVDEFLLNIVRVHSGMDRYGRLAF